MNTDHRPYQGYPYSNPTIFDVPTISADDAARWQHLPRRQIEVNVTRDRPTTSPQPEVLPVKRDSVPAPVVYIDMPETSGSIVADRRPASDDNFEILPMERPQNMKPDPDAPVVYIDMPDAGGVAASRDQTPDPGFVQETIFYDPFENRRIDRGKDNDGSDDDDDDDDDDDIPQTPRRPDFLDLYGAGPSGSSAQPMPSMMSKEASIYTARENGFPVSPIPVSQFPDPPPSYTEIEPVVAQPRPHRPHSPPRTQVILPQDNPPTLLRPRKDRKYLNCQHCRGMLVHALVVYKAGCPTHLTAAFCFLIGCFPVVILIYWLDVFKVRNHYCPNCNNIIGYQRPLSEEIIYVPI